MLSAQEEARLKAVAARQPHPTKVTFDGDSALIEVQSSEFPQFQTSERLTLQQIKDAETKRDVEAAIISNNELISRTVEQHKRQLKASAEEKARIVRGRKR